MERSLQNLKKNKSDIEVTVRNEGSQIQRSFETSLKSNFNEMKQVLNDKFEEHSKYVRRNTAILITLIVTQIAIGVLVFLF